MVYGFFCDSIKRKINNEDTFVRITGYQKRIYYTNYIFVLYLLSLKELESYAETFYPRIRKSSLVALRLLSKDIAQIIEILEINLLLR